MGKLFRLLLIITLLVATVPANCWVISDYRVQADIRPDSSLYITETVVADFGQESRHGIYRGIPLSGRDKWGNKYRLRFSDLQVTDENNVRLQTQVTDQMGRTRIRIGDPDRTVSGRQVYVIRYHLLRAIHFFERYDELYWNVFGHEWEVPIMNATSIVTLPADVPKNQIHIAAYTGHYGSTSSDVWSQIPDQRTVRIWSTKQLNPGEGMTIVVGWPKGVVTQPTFSQETLWFITDNGFFFLPLFFIPALFLLWTRVGRDPDTGRSEAVHYDPPDNLSPAELGTLIDEKVDTKDISASILDLAVRGYVTIVADVQDSLLGKKVDYTLRLRKPGEELRDDPGLSNYEHALIRAIFGTSEFRIMSTLKHRFYIHLPGLRDQLYDGLIDKGYWTHRPDSVRGAYRTAGIMVAVAGGALAFNAVTGMIPIGVNIGWGLAVALCGIILMFAAHTMPRKTGPGKNALLAARGFEEYLSRAEAGLIRYQEREGYFEKFLPYAMVFGIADQWAKAFDGIDMKPPEWYYGDTGSFRPSLFTHDLNRASMGWASDMASQARSDASSGSSFFGGGSGFSGGFSGGGGGGGGGGSW